jgi:hypothetical protein
LVGARGFELRARAAAEAGTENKPVIAAVNRCATPKSNSKIEFFGNKSRLFRLHFRVSPPASRPIGDRRHMYCGHMH